jgi:hypothetical protein
MTRADAKSPDPTGAIEAGVTKMDALRYLTDLRSFYATYHNHKEASAWAAAALYLVLLEQLSVSVKTGVPPDMGTRAVVTVVIVVLGVTVFVHLQAQMSMRRRAANYVAACLSLSLEIMDGSASGDFTAWFGPKASGDARLPEVIIERGLRYGEFDQGTRQRLEWSVYIAVIVCAFAALARVWF